MSSSLLLLQPHFLQQLPRFSEELRPAYQQPLLQRQPSSPRRCPQTGVNRTLVHVKECLLKYFVFNHQRDETKAELKSKCFSLNKQEANLP